MPNSHPHRARKRFGQNFLQDTAVIRHILECVGPKPGEHLVEIGPGQGAITRYLLEAAGALDAVELDRDLIEPLTRLCAGRGDLRLHNADILKFDLCALVRDDRPLRVVGNLPYNISTPILFHLLEQAGCIRDMHFMLQKEVVERMAALPGGKEYGRLSVMLQARCEVTPLFEIPPSAFRPAPKVDSGFVRLIPLARPPAQIDDFGFFSEVVAQAFAQRRKTLRNSLSKLLTAEAIEALGIDPGLRAERLDVAAFARLANKACKKA